MGFLDNTGLGHLISKIKATFFAKADAVEVVEVEVDSTPTADSENLVTSGGVKSYVDGAIPSPPTVDQTYDGTSTNAQSGVAMAGALAGKENSTNKVTSLNAQSTATQFPAAKTVYDFVKPETKSSMPSGGFLPGVKYRLGTITGSRTFTLSTPADSSVENEYKFTFSTGNTAPSITWPSGITKWAGNIQFQNGLPIIVTNKTYEVNIEGGIAFITQCQ